MRLQTGRCLWATGFAESKVMVPGRGRAEQPTLSLQPRLQSRVRAGAEATADPGRGSAIDPRHSRIAPNVADLSGALVGREVELARGGDRTHRHVVRRPVRCDGRQARN